ncbi:MAG: hypothetical protein Q7R35_14035 [Elusimicrobiota bacterium]|nr:hypothetical protein [Elusimicrobiota bacterium]
MKTKILLAVFVTMTAAAAFAAERPAAGAASVKTSAAQPEKPGEAGLSSVMDLMDAIDKENLDIEANYWAWRVTEVKDTTYEELLGYSKKWIMKPGTRDRLMAGIRKILDSGSARALTAAEMNKFDESKQKVRALLAPGSQDKKLISELSLDYCIELKARYWAKRVQDGEKEILERMPKWGLNSDAKKKLIAAVGEKLKQENAKLSREELYKLDACTEKMN